MQRSAASTRRVVVLEKLARGHVSQLVKRAGSYSKNYSLTESSILSSSCLPLKYWICPHCVYNNTSKLIKDRGYRLKQMEPGSRGKLISKATLAHIKKTSSFVQIIIVPSIIKKQTSKVVSKWYAQNNSTGCQIGNLIK